MVTLRLRYENGYFVLVHPLLNLKEGDEIEVEVMRLPEDSALNIMFASEAILRRDWDTPEEDAAWANL